MADSVTTLEGVVITGLVIDNEFDFSGVSAQVQETIGGGLVVWEAVRSGKPLDLVGGTNFGVLSRSILKSVAALAAVPNATYTLIHNSRTCRVRFRHEDGAPLSAQPIVARPNQADTDYYNNVSIKLMEV